MGPHQSAPSVPSVAAPHCWGEEVQPIQFKHKSCGAGQDVGYDGACYDSCGSGWTNNPLVPGQCVNGPQCSWLSPLGCAKLRPAKQRQCAGAGWHAHGDRCRYNCAQDYAPDFLRNVCVRDQGCNAGDVARTARGWVDYFRNAYAGQIHNFEQCIGPIMNSQLTLATVAGSPHYVGCIKTFINGIAYGDLPSQAGGFNPKYLAIDFEVSGHVGAGFQGGFGIVYGVKPGETLGEIQVYAGGCLGLLSDAEAAVSVSFSVWENKHRIPGVSVEVGIGVDISPTGAGVGAGFDFFIVQPINLSPFFIQRYEATATWAFGFGFAVGVGISPIDISQHFCKVSELQDGKGVFG